MTQLSLDFHPTIPLTVTCDAPHISSDGGARLVGQLEDPLRLRERVAALLPDEREPRKVKQDRHEPRRPRLSQRALG